MLILDLVISLPKNVLELSADLVLANNSSPRFRYSTEHTTEAPFKYSTSLKEQCVIMQ